MKPFVFDVDRSSFQKQVLDASREVPVVVDFWAQWCAPCKALAPVLEKLAAEHQGTFLLAKVDTDREAELAARYGIRGIPDVKAFVDGRIAAEFSGALPESAVRGFLAKVVPSPAERLRRGAANALRDGDFEAAESRLNEALKLDPDNLAARLDLIELLIARQAWSEAQLQMRNIPERAREERADRLASRIASWSAAQSLPGVTELEAALRNDPGRLEARLQLAQRHMVESRYEQALEQLLEVVRRDRGALRDRARTAMVEVFGFAGEAEYVSRYRRLLASALY